MTTAHLSTGLPTSIPWKQLIVVFMSWRLWLLGWAMLADYFLPYAPSFPYAETILAASDTPRWWYSWGNFDGVHYLTIAQKGYLGTGLIQAFFPLWPIILAVGYNLSGQLVSTAIILSNLMGLLMLITWYRFVFEITNSRQQAWVATAIILLWPTSFFWVSVYSESLFLTLVLGTFLAAKAHRWWLAGLIAALASGTRVVGIALVPALLLEWWLQQPSAVPTTRRLLRLVRPTTWMPMSLGSLGLLAYMGYLWRNFSDPLFFFHVQQEFGSGRAESIILFPQVVWRYLKIILTVNAPLVPMSAYVHELVIGVGGLLGLIWSATKVRWSWVLFAVIAFLIPTLTGTFSSMPRYVLVCFPLWLGLSAWAVAHPRLALGLTPLLLILSAFFTVLFIQGYWVG